ncbi:uncharacterized protein SCHCODRAFT_02520631 [Schizophyllum commune H4-8]|uniref:Expressed protein n=1 Tax=Schizophyllum commune (strain H4-8 / FGSC 9210) TaxID=578458 RepID=D8QL69_SCHCM|nr:uncharacterized protein SCHCODRAFT_02520631 [Schizophyllum commune H4-8]KAI5885264.1 hypothetical protein SCHCODRAFT_02520631 [Schizophyllum commune H4-8]
MSNLPPPDLLSLSRTSKWFRGLLMKRSARYIWLRSFELVGLPPVPYPDECAEPEVVEALLGKCHFCKKAVPHPFGSFSLPFIWACYKCASPSLWRYDERRVRKSSMALVKRADVLDLVPSTKGGKNPQFYTPYLRRLEDEYTNVVDDDEAREQWVKKRKTLLRQSKEQYDEACQRWLREYQRPFRERFVEKLKQFMKYVELHDPELEVEFWYMNSNEQIAFQKATEWRKYPVNDKRWKAIGPRAIEILQKHRHERLKNTDGQTAGPIERVWGGRNCTAG